jgi:hypothetical protein
MPSLQLRRSLSQQHAVEGRPLIQSFLRPVFGRSATLSLQQAASRGAIRIFLAIGRTYSERAGRRRINEFVSSGSTLTAVSAWASPSGDGSTRAAAATLPEPTMVSAHSRDDPLATVSQCRSNEHEPSLACQNLLVQMVRD